MVEEDKKKYTKYVPGLSKARGPRLKPFRMAQIDQGMTTTELARRLGVKRQTLNARWNKDDCNIVDCEKMAAALGLKFVWHLEEADAPQKEEQQ